MSTSKLVSTIEKELKRLNDIIDGKIIEGLSYRKESQRHKFLTSQLVNLKRVSGDGWFARSVSFVNTFVF